jgi:hypothetical protein
LDYEFQAMTKFELEIRYPQHLNASDAEQLGTMTAEDVLSQFDAVPWRRLQMQQLRMEGSSTSLTITGQQPRQSMRLTMNAYTDLDQLEFRMESDIEIVTSKKDMFGLLNRKIKDYVAFKKLNQDQAREYLKNFVDGQMELLTQQYQQNK